MAFHQHSYPSTPTSKHATSSFIVKDASIRPLRYVIIRVKNSPLFSGNSHKKTPWPESTSEFYRPNDRRLSAKLVPTFLQIKDATWSQ
jgi:hypothetical protein